LKIALIFNDYAFFKQNRSVSQEGNSLDHVLLAGYLDYTACVPQPVDPDCLKDADFDSQYSRLFQLPHLELVHSSYFGAVGVQESLLKASPLHKEILQVLPADEHNPCKALSSHAMKMARQLYQTNFQNMWADNSIVNKLLTRLLRCLLVYHLCPEEDRKFKANKKDLRDKGKGKGKQVLRDTNASIFLHVISLINMTRNSRRRLFRKEEKKLEKYQSKGNTTAAERCQVRLDTYREMLAREVSVFALSTYVATALNIASTASKERSASRNRAAATGHGKWRRRGPTCTGGDRGGKVARHTEKTSGEARAGRSIGSLF